MSNNSKRTRSVLNRKICSGCNVPLAVDELCIDCSLLKLETLEKIVERAKNHMLNHSIIETQPMVRDMVNRRGPCLECEYIVMKLSKVES